MIRPLAVSMIATVVLALVAFGLATATVSAQTLKSGSFRGAGGHKSSGGVRIVKANGATRVVFSANFKLDSAPDARIAFGNGRYQRGTIFARLRKLRGSQSYVVPARLKAERFSQVWLWCKRFNAPLAVARVR